MFPLYQRYVPTIARLLMCVIFLLSGFNKVTNFSGTEGYMAAHGMTTGTAVLLVLAIIVEIGGGVALLLGFRVRAVSVMLFLYLIPATLMFHNFWAYSDPAMRQDQMLHFLKNLTILGGLLALSVAGAGAPSLDAAIARARRPFWAFWRRRAI
jgi:putative oxidoreductase